MTASQRRQFLAFMRSVASQAVEAQADRISLADLTDLLSDIEDDLTRAIAIVNKDWVSNTVQVELDKEE